MSARPGGRRAVLLSVALLAVLFAGVLAERAMVRAEVPPPPDYGAASAWLCRPGRSDVCSTPTTATVFEATARHVATYSPDLAAPIDCFYVYPTVSHARSDNAPIAATDDETGAAQQQFARFSSVCRTFAPLYRQVTRDGLGRVFMNPDPDAAPRRIAYGDIVAAWHQYLANDNHGRGVVLIGHSQGAKILARLIAAEIDGTPVAARLVSAIVPGTKIDVPRGGTVGGTFKHVPLCTNADQTGCVIAYSTFPADHQTPADAVFGETHTPGMVYACVDPAAIAGTPTLGADLPLWGNLRQKLGTDFAEVPGVISATCRMDGALSILAVAAAPTDRAGEKAAVLLERIAEYKPTWGLHALDINLAEGTLVDIVRRQAVTYAHH